MNKKILIIDDEGSEYECLKACFEDTYLVLPEDYSGMAKAVDPNCEGEGVKEYVKRQIQKNYQDIGLILCDIAGAHGGDPSWGPDIIESIREIEIQEFPKWTEQVPIIALTQYADPNIKIDVVGDKRADFVLSKPKSETDKTILKQTVNKSMNNFEKFIIMNKPKEKVFIVHGHDAKVKETVARFLEKLNLDAVILHEQPDYGATIIEKIERYAADASYAVVLYTACDLGREKNETDLKPRARQNVVFEHGYMISKLGREKVCALVDKDVTPPGDMDGVIFVRFDESGAWKNELVKNMKPVMKLDRDKILEALCH